MLAGLEKVILKVTFVLATGLPVSPPTGNLFWQRNGQFTFQRIGSRVPEVAETFPSGTLFRQLERRTVCQRDWHLSERQYRVRFTAPLTTSFKVVRSTGLAARGTSSGAVTGFVTGKTLI